MKKYVKVDSVEDYFSLPKKERQWLGIYLKPISLPFSPGKEDIGWIKWSRRIRKEYPIQGFVREWLFDYDNPVYAFIVRSYDFMNNARHNVRRFFKPCHSRFRKAYPRHKWSDITEAIVDVNFGMILDFYYEEVVDGHIDWESDDAHKEFMRGLIKAVEWIETGYPEAEKELNEAYDKVDPDAPYPDAYQNVEEIEKRIEDETTEALTFMINNRAFFWT